MQLSAKPVIIIGAARSGTNMLRDVLADLPEVATWPCDEINYIWRHGNVRFPSDEFTPDMARAEVRQYIRGQFNWVTRNHGGSTVLEKTCANSLRVGFVDRVIPEAKYIFIHRDGLDAVGSALKRWKAPLNIPYLARKARFVPVTDLPYHVSRYIGSRVYRLFSPSGRVAFWGPQFAGMSEMLATHSLEEVCGLQWQRCVEAAEKALREISDRRWIRVAYEDFVSEPAPELERILDFLELSTSGDEKRRAIAGVSAASIGKGRRSLDSATAARLEALLHGTQARFGYG